MSGLKCATSVGWNVAKVFPDTYYWFVCFERLLFVICYMHMYMYHADVWSWVSLSESASSTQGGGCHRGGSTAVARGGIGGEDSMKFMSGLKCATSVGWNVAKCFLILVCKVVVCHMLHAHVPCRCLELGEPERVSLEYAQQLLLGTLLSICNSLCKDGVDDARG